MPRRRKTFVLLLILALVLAGWYARHRGAVLNAQREAQFLALFEQSFNSGTTQLVGKPQLQGIYRWQMSEFGPGSFRAPGVNEYVVTAQVSQGGRLMWARWLYTCNGDHGNGIYKFSYAEGAHDSALPAFPFPLQRYIPWTGQLIDGIPSTAGASVTNVAVSSPVKVTDDLVISASAPVGTTCRLEIFPRDALLSPPLSQQPTANGKVAWTCRLNPRHAGSRLAVKIHCAEPRGSKMLDNETSGPNIEVLSNAAGSSVRSPQ